MNDPPARTSGGTALQLAAIKGFFGITWMLLENGADVNGLPSKMNGRTALEGAAEYGRIDTVQLLLNVGADMEGPRRLRNGLAIQLAEENGHLATVELLRAHLLTHDQQMLAITANTDAMSMAEQDILQVQSAAPATLGYDDLAGFVDMRMDMDWRVHTEE